MSFLAFFQWEIAISILFDAFLATSILFRNRHALVTSLVQNVHRLSINNVGGGRRGQIMYWERTRTLVGFKRELTLDHLPSPHSTVGGVIHLIP